MKQTRILLSTPRMCASCTYEGKCRLSSLVSKHNRIIDNDVYWYTVAFPVIPVSAAWLSYLATGEPFAGLPGFFGGMFLGSLPIVFAREALRAELKTEIEMWEKKCQVTSDLPSTINDRQ